MILKAGPQRMTHVLAVGERERQTLIVALRGWERQITAVPRLAATRAGQEECARIRTLIAALQNGQ